MSTVTPSSRPVPQRPRVPAPGRPRPTKLTPNIDPIRILRRYMITLAFMLIIGCGLGVGLWKYLDLKHPQYPGEVLFQIQSGLRESSDFGTFDNVMNDDAVVRIAETESVILTSRPVLEIAVQNPEVMQTDWYQSFEDSETGVISVDKAVDDLVENLGAGLLPGTSFFRLSWRYSTPEDVPIVLNAVAETYDNRRKEEEKQRFSENLREVRNRLLDTTNQIQNTTETIKRHIRDSGITNLNDAHYSQTSKNLEDLGSQLAATDAAKNLAETQYQQTNLKISGTLEPSEEDYVTAENDTLVRPVSIRILDLKTNLRVLRNKYPDAQNPQIVSMEEQIAASEAEKAAKMDEIIKRNLEARLKVLADQIEQSVNNKTRLEAEIEELTDQMSQLVADQTELDKLEEERRQLESRRSGDIELVKEIELMQVRTNEASAVKLAQYAETPREKAFPKPVLIIPLTGFALFGITLGLVFLRELTDQRVKSAADLDVVPNARVLGVLPDITEEPRKISDVEAVVQKHPRSILAESYRQATSPIVRCMEQFGHQTLLVAGGMPGAGTTTVITNIATILASSGKSVLVIDANFRRPRLAKALGLNEGAGQGLGDILAGETSMSSVLQSTESGIQVIGAGTPANRVFERLGTQNFDSLLAEARAEFDFILIDVPPAIVAGDSSTLANKVDAAVLVVRANQEQRGLVVRLINQFGQANCELLGVLLNRPRGTVGGYFRKNFATMAKYGDAGQK